MQSQQRVSGCSEGWGVRGPPGCVWAPPIAPAKEGVGTPSRPLPAFLPRPTPVLTIVGESKAEFT